MHGKVRGNKISILARIVLFILFIVSFATSMLPWGRAFARSTLLLPALVAGSQPLPLQTFGESIQHKQMTTPSRGGTVFLDVYEPTAAVPLVSSVHSGVVIIPGVGDNRQVPQLINLSEALARTGIVVMNMVTPTLINYDLSAQDGDAVVRAFQTLSHLPGMEGKHIGIISFSAGVPLACFGAADPRIRDKVSYVTVFGGYFNTRNVLRAFGRRAIDIDGHTERWVPTAVPIETLTNVITKNLLLSDQKSIKEALAPGNAPLTPKEFGQLTPGGQAAYQLLTGSAPKKTDTNIAALPAATRAQLDILSPSLIIAQIHAPIFLLHDRNDTSIPVTESRDLAQALAHLHHPYEYVEFHIFDHVEVRSNLQLGQLLNDGSHLFGVLTDLLSLAS